jgi:hypothetical protein
LTTTFFAGIEKPMAPNAARILSFASDTALSGRPTMMNFGRPEVADISTTTFLD